LFTQTLQVATAIYITANHGLRALYIKFQVPHWNYCKP